MTNGKIIDGRYEIIEEVGRGGMAIVYLAKCLVLNRYVAIKVLRPEFRDDADFIKRFKIEAQSAGSLSHPNVVSVYDVGNEDDLEYIVMEYVEGITLKQYLGAKGTLTQTEAVDFASQICAGLEHAHKKGIVHKDIKPENIIITKEGILKITDFGIAKALNQGTIATGDLAMGSVHYFSPEQARGSFTDAKTDLYSVGIILYEMVTGKLPFDGENAISIAMKHIETEPVNPSQINSSITDSLEIVILKAMKKDQTERYQSATQMLIDLKKVSVGSYVSYDSPARKVPGTDKISSEEKSSNSSPVPRMRSTDVEAKPKGRAEVTAAKKKKKKADTIAIVAGIIAAVVLVSGLAVLWTFMSSGGSNNEIKCPDFLNMTCSEVLDKTKEFPKLNVILSDGSEINEDMEGVVVEQSPKGGKSIKNSATIKIKLGEPPAEKIEIPDIENMLEGDAIDILKERGFKPKVEDKPSSDIEEGRVIETSPKIGSLADKGAVITIYISSGEEDKYTRVPNLYGKTEADADAALKEAGLILGETTSVTSDKPSGTVVEQSRTDGDRVKKGTAIDLKISNGKGGTTQAPPETTIPVPSNPAAE